MAEDHQQKSTLVSMRETVNIVSFAARIHEYMMAPFIRYGFGSQYFGFLAVAAFFIQLWLSGVYRDLVMYRAAWVWLAVLAVHRVMALCRWITGGREHSRWSGYSLLPFDDRTAKAAEPFICFVIGALLTPFSYVLGRIWMYGLFSLGYLHVIKLMADASRKRAISDAVIQAEHDAQLFAKQQRR